MVFNHGDQICAATGDSTPPAVAAMNATLMASDCTCNSEFILVTNLEGIWLVMRQVSQNGGRQPAAAPPLQTPPPRPTAAPAVPQPQCVPGTLQPRSCRQ